jgi:hypothetical protein
VGNDKPLSPRALEQARAPELAPDLADPHGPLPPACPVPTAGLGSLWECFYQSMNDPRKPRGVRHQLAGVLTLIALAVIAGCKGPHAIAEFARSLNPAQRRCLCCRPRPDRPGHYEVPCERTFRRLLKAVDPEELKAVLVGWMQTQDPAPLRAVHADGKVVSRLWCQKMKRSAPSFQRGRYRCAPPW